jgi:hypothetical protein
VKRKQSPVPVDPAERSFAALQKAYKREFTGMPPEQALAVAQRVLEEQMMGWGIHAPLAITLTPRPIPNVPIAPKKVRSSSAQRRASSRPFQARVPKMPSQNVSSGEVLESASI